MPRASTGCSTTLGRAPWGISWGWFTLPTAGWLSSGLMCCCWALRRLCQGISYSRATCRGSRLECRAERLERIGVIPRTDVESCFSMVAMPGVSSLRRILENALLN